MIELSFDPALRIGDLVIRWQTIFLTLALLEGLGLAALIDGRRIAVTGRRRALRIDDLIYIVLGIVPGAVVGGRLVHGLAFWEQYSSDPLRLLDVSVGTLSLTGALLGGAISAVYVARTIGAPVRRWADAAAVPLLVVMGLGKLAQLFGGSGQGAPFDGPWAVAFVGPGPWISPTPEIPAHPAQIYEGLWLLLGVPVVLGWATRYVKIGTFIDRLRTEHGNGRTFAAMLVWFLLGRVIVGFSWRDDRLIGPLNVEQAVALAMLVGLGTAAALIWSRSIVEANRRMTPRERRP